MEEPLFTAVDADKFHTQITSYPRGAVGATGSKNCRSLRFRAQSG
jgi:hypothetical protein